jgi:3-phosphoshikimate 1-carboxyvinyltransferase
VNELIIKKASRLQGDIELPGDKSISHRAIIFSCLSSGRCRISNICSGEDASRTLEIFRNMGIEGEQTGPYDHVICGRGLQGLQEPATVLYTGNSGTTTRLMAGLLSAQRFFTVLSGDASLNSRPMKRVVEPLRLMGAAICGRSDGNFAPLAITGTRLQGIEYALTVASAQIKSCLMLAGLYADGMTTITEPALSRDHTERMLEHLGVRVARKGPSVSISAAADIRPEEYEIPGDISSAAFYIVAALIVPGSEIRLRGIGVNPTRTGCLDILKNMGASIDLENQRLMCGEPVADIIVRSSRLRATAIRGELIPRAIDEIPILSVAAACAEGTTVVSDASELRVKESDRIATMCSELAKCGISAVEQKDGMIITGAESISGGICQSHGDHRIAMSLAVAGLIAKTELAVKDCDCINTSFPEFMVKLGHLTGKKSS